MNRRTGINQSWVHEFGMHVKLKLALVAIMRQDYGRPSKGSAAAACSGKYKLIALQKVRSPETGPVGPRGHAFGAIPDATTVEQSPLINKRGATGLRAGVKAVSLSTRRETSYY